MKIKLLLLLLIFSASSFAQGEANNWFFGLFGGIQFQEDGTVLPLSGGQMLTNEGCSTISDADGNLLFYTDGRNVWDRNHVLMPNGNYNMGTGLNGDPSSTQSGIIVPKKDSPDIYYIFTVDEPHHDNATSYPNQFTGIYSDTQDSVPSADDGFNNGLNYSIVDLSITGANGSIGDVTTRNVHLVTYNPANIEELKFKCSEKITAVKNGDGTGYWVIAHFTNKFYAFAVSATGVNETPVVTEIAPLVPLGGYRRNAIGCIKVSPSGDKLAIAHQQFGLFPGLAEPTGAVYLYDFNNVTGVLSSPVQIMNNISPYGVEFSPQGKKLYVSYSNEPSSGNGFINQYDLLAGNIPASAFTVGFTSQAGTLQLGPNGKIYRAVISSSFLDVIAAPEEDGALCNFQPSSQFISGTCVFGLPPFITSFFSANILIANKCEGQPTQFDLNVNGSFDSVVWDFGDGTPTSAETEPTHTYNVAGSYNITATITRQGETTEISSQVTIADIPVANTPGNLVGCDPDNNGVTTFALSDNTNAILGTQSNTLFDVKYFTSQANADTNTGALNAASYTNITNPETIYARVYNKLNSTCYSTTSFQISVSNTPVLLGNSYSQCDDDLDGDDANGITQFDLAAVTESLVQDHLNYTTTYYLSEANATNESDALPATFSNTTANEQVIFARIVNTAAPTCFTIQPITLRVNNLPAPTNEPVLVQCDTGVVSDGITRFNLTEANNLLTQGNPDGNLAVQYYLSTTEAATGSPLPFSYTNTSNPQTIVAKITNTITGCVRIQELRLQVNTNNTSALQLERCDDDANEDGHALFNLADAGLEGTADSVTYYAFLHDALMEQNPIAADYTNVIVNLQNVYARLENNNDCVALQEIKLIVRPLPDIAPTAEAIVCVNTGELIELTSGVAPNATGYNFEWSTGETTSSIWVNQPGTYTVNVINNNNISACGRLRTITVNPSDVAVIDHIAIVDLVDNSTVTVYVHPTGNVATTYAYSLDAPDGPFQDSNYFQNVAPGIHTVYVSDSQGCGVVSKEIAVLGIPKFFTPNGDGINDTWDIIGINSKFYKNSQINIFDRFGKLVGGVDPKGRGWDGTYNGRRLPATDYWYVITLETGRVVKGHFSMIR